MPLMADSLTVQRPTDWLAITDSLTDNGWLIGNDWLTGTIQTNNIDTPETHCIENVTCLYADWTWIPWEIEVYTLLNFEKLL